jgi:large subunit ribosomal protein L21
MSYAVIKTGGKQYIAQPGKILRIEKLNGEKGGEVVFDRVLLNVQDDASNLELGTPFIEGAKVTAKVLEQGRSKKIRVIKFKNKTRQKKVHGHRQYFTKVEITEI